MRRLLFITTILFISLASFAQENAESKAILDKAYNAYRTSEDIRLSFNLHVTDPNGTTYKPESGTALIKGDKFKITTPSMVVWFNGKTQWVLLKEANEVNITNPTNEEIATISPLALLGMYKNGYNLKKPIAKKLNGKNVHVIELIPAKSNKEFVKITVSIDKKSHTIVQVILKLKNGTTNKIDITNYITNNKFADSEFVFNKKAYSGPEIIDLR